MPSTMSNCYSLRSMDDRLRNAALTLSGPDGSPLCVPAVVDPASDAYASLRTDSSIKGYYDENGYIVVRGLVPDAECDRARDAFEQEVKPYRGHIYRQASADPEIHRFNERGFMLNSILNIQDLSREDFPRFRQAGLELITHPNLHRIFSLLLGEPGNVVQSMYFEGNPVTWAHQDTYYLDSADLGKMVAAWIAVEDIHPGAGRFYVYPGSHKIDMHKNGGDFDIAFNHARYKQLVLDVIARHGLECRAPAMRKGDVLFWGSRTIHGSLDTVAPEHSRASFTTHVVPRSKAFLQYQSREKPLALQEINGVPVHCPKDQNRWLNRAIMGVEVAFPDLFRAVKRAAIKLVTH